MADAIPPCNAEPKRREYDTWLDVLRFVAMFFVVVSHAGDTFNMNAPEGDDFFSLMGQLWGSLARFCVPIFAMMTGYLLLPVRTGWGAFEKKRIGRLMGPFLFWSVAYCLLPLIVGACGGDLATLKNFIPFTDAPACDWSTSLMYLKRIPLSFCMMTTHLWYVYMLIGLYLALPLVSPWFERASGREKLAFLGLWAGSLSLPYLRVATHGWVWGECAWNDCGLFYSFGGFLGYAVLGSVLGKMRALSWGRTLAIAVPLFVAGYLVTFFGYRHSMIVTGGDYDKYADTIELYWQFLSPNAAAMSVAVFLLAKKATRVPAGLAAALKDINICGFGIYCVHYAVIGICYNAFLKRLGIPTAILLPVLALVAYMCTWGVVHALRKVPFLRGKIV